jgi:hypothetical protein
MKSEDYLDAWTLDRWSLDRWNWLEIKRCQTTLS